MERKTGGLDWKGVAAKLFCILVAILGGWFCIKLASTVLVVFFIAWGVAAVIDPLARRTEARVKIPRKLCAALYVILLLFGLGFLAFFALSHLFEEAKELMIWVEDHREWIGESVGGFFESVNEWVERLPFGEQLGQDGEGVVSGTSVDSMITGLVQESVSGVGAWLTNGVGNLLRATPRALIVLIVTVMACFYLSMDYVGIRDRLIGLLPARMAEKADRFRIRAGKAIRNYIRAYVVLLLITFTEVFIGLWILGQPFPFLIALVVALIDILPVLGAGTILIPWAIVMLLLNNYSFGFGLLILYGVVTIVRQIAEPHIVGGSLGIHPLMSLFFMFAGLQLFGFFGMLLGPAVALIVKECFLRDSERGGFVENQ